MKMLMLIAIFYYKLYTPPVEGDTSSQAAVLHKSNASWN